jgi:hypothetical protein
MKSFRQSLLSRRELIKALPNRTITIEVMTVRHDMLLEMEKIRNVVNRVAHLTLIKIGTQSNKCKANNRTSFIIKFYVSFYLINLIQFNDY